LTYILFVAHQDPCTLFYRSVPRALLTTLHGVIICWVEDFAIKMSSLHDVPVGLLLRLAKVLPSRWPTAPSPPPYEISPVTLLRMHSLPSSRSSVKMVLAHDTRGTPPLLAGHHLDFELLHCWNSPASFAPIL